MVHMLGKLVDDSRTRITKHKNHIL